MPQRASFFLKKNCREKKRLFDLTVRCSFDSRACNVSYTVPVQQYGYGSCSTMPSTAGSIMNAQALCGIFLLCFCASTSAHSLAQPTQGFPVVIIPGDGSSVLEARLTGKTSKHFYCARHSSWFRLWLNALSLTPPAINCWAENIQLEYEAKSGTYHNRPGVETRTPGWGTLEGLNLDKDIPFELSNPWEQLICKLKRFGYVPGHSLRAAPYDFRFAIGPEYIQRLQKLVEETFLLNGGRRVVLVSHSMGCLYTLKFLNTLDAKWKAKYVEHWIPV